MSEELVTYTFELDGKLIAVEHVPARVDPETREQFFAPETVERLQQIAWKQQKTKRFDETPVFEFVA